MKVITVKSRCENIAERFSEVYNSNLLSEYTLSDRRKPSQIIDQLTLLQGKGTKEQVDKIIGNTIWTDCRCHECGKSVSKVIQLGEPEDYNSSTANICFDCLQNAIVELSLPTYEDNK